MKNFWVGFFIFWPIVAVIACLIAPGMNWWFPRHGEGMDYSAFTPLGQKIDSLFYLILYIVTATFIGTQIALGYVLWKGAHIGAGEKALFTHGSHNLEVIWSIVPAGILLFIALYQMDVWANPFTPLRVPKMFNLRMDPYEHAPISGSMYDQWRVENAYLFAKATMLSAEFLETFVEYPPSQRPASFSIDQVRKQVDKKIDESFKKRGLE